MAKITSIKKVKFDSKVPVYDLINVEDYHNFSVKVSESTSVISHNCAMGDLMKYDFITRYTAVLTGKPYYDVTLHPDKYFNVDVREVANNIDLITLPAGRLTTEELISIVENAPIEYDVIVADYDSNFKTEGDNMYQQGGDIYNDLTAIARPDKKKARLVFVAAQPKIQFWDEVKIPESGAGESSRKQHIIDMMITLGSAGLDRPAGILHLAKVRRGKAGADIGYVMDDSGRFKEITKEELALMRRYS